MFRFISKRSLIFLPERFAFHEQYDYYVDVPGIIRIRSTCVSLHEFITAGVSLIARSRFPRPAELIAVTL